MPKRKILFIDRDGTLIVEPEDEQIDRLDKLALVDDVIPALREAIAAGYELVMVSNQDGLGTASFPEADFHGPHQLMLQIFASQGIKFVAEHIDRSFPEEGLFTRKPGLGMVLDYLKSGDLDLAASAFIGDRATDMEMAAAMGIRGFLIGPDDYNWPQIIDELIHRPRVAEVVRETSETRIRCRVDLDASRTRQISTGIGFFDHMIDQLGKHGGFGLDLRCEGDLHIDQHHTVEDCALALGEALYQALGDKRGIGRYGFVLPMDETQASAAIDLGGRPFLKFEGDFRSPRVGEFDVEMVPHFFRSFADALRATLHVEVRGDNTHHMIEGAFKAVARALKPALQRGDGQDVPSSKGMLA